MIIDESVYLAGRLGWTDFQAARTQALARLSPDPYIAHGRRAEMALSELIAAWNAHDPAAVAAEFAPDGVRHQLAFPERRLAGREAIAGGVGEILLAFPDAQLSVRRRSVGHDGQITLEWVFTGTQHGDLDGLPASAAAVRLAGVSLCALDGAGRISEERVYWDTATLMAAAGHIA